MGKMWTPIVQQTADLGAKMLLADYVGAKLHLFSNDVTPSLASVLGDFTEVIADGVVAQTVTWSAAFPDADGSPVSSGGEKLFVQDDVVGDSCYGAYLTNTAGTKLLAAARLDAPPFLFVNPGDTLPLALKLGLVDGFINTELAD